MQPDESGTQSQPWASSSQSAHQGHRVTRCALSVTLCSEVALLFLVIFPLYCIFPVFPLHHYALGLFGHKLKHHKRQGNQQPPCQLLALRKSVHFHGLWVSVFKLSRQHLYLSSLLPLLVLLGWDAVACKM